MGMFGRSALLDLDRSFRVIDMLLRVGCSEARDSIGAKAQGCIDMCAGVSIPSARSRNADEIDSAPTAAERELRTDGLGPHCARP